MGFKEWLGGDKPVSQFAFNLLIIYITCFYCTFTILEMIQGVYLTNKKIKHDDLMAERELERTTRIYKGIYEEINRLKVKVKECKK